MELNENILKDSLVTLFKCISEGIIISDSEGIIIMANPSAHQMFGYEKTEMVNLPIEDLIPKRFNHKRKVERYNYAEVPPKRIMKKTSAFLRKEKMETNSQLK